MKKVYGKYSTLTQARRIVEELLDQGYTQNQIKVVSNKDLGKNLDGVYDDNKVDDRSLWEKIKDAFTFDEYDDNYWDKELDSNERNLLESYRNDLKDGDTIVLVEEGVDTNFKDTNTGYDGVMSDEERVIQLKKEKLNIDKDVVETGEVNIKKVIKEDVETVEVPITKEEIVIERRPVHDKEGFVGEIEDEVWDENDEIHIPIKEERVDINKKTVLDDEVVVKKVQHQENKKVSETVRHEEVEVDGDTDLIDDKLKGKGPYDKR